MVRLAEVRPGEVHAAFKILRPPGVPNGNSSTAMANDADVASDRKVSDRAS